MVFSKSAQVFAVALLIFSPIAAIAEKKSSKPTLVEHRKIWDAGNHNAFTDLARFKNQWFCVFREANAHVSPDGNVRVLSSADGKEWNSAALLSRDGFDLRDPKLSIAPDGRLMLLAGATVREGHSPATESQSFVMYSDDGKKWGEMQWAGPTNHWLWRVTWHKANAYGVAYDVSPPRRAARLYGTILLRSENGVDYKNIVPNLFSELGPTEATLRFAKDDTLYCLQRRDGRPHRTAFVGRSKPPYEKWEWKDLGLYFGGPNFLQIPDGRWIAAGRIFNDSDKPETVVCELDPEKGKLNVLLTLPSGGDTSYPGMVWHENLLWMSYYSSHEGKTSIYITKLKFE